MPAPPDGPWNWGLPVRRKSFERRGQTITAMDLHRLLVRLKRTPRDGWLYKVSKCAPQEALRDLDLDRAGLVAASSAETQNACGEGSAGRAATGPVDLPSVRQERVRIPTLIRTDG